MTVTSIVESLLRLSSVPKTTSASTSGSAADMVKTVGSAVSTLATLAGDITDTADANVSTPTEVTVPSMDMADVVNLGISAAMLDAQMAAQTAQGNALQTTLQNVGSPLVRQSNAAFIAATHSTGAASMMATPIVAKPSQDASTSFIFGGQDTASTIAAIMRHGNDAPGIYGASETPRFGVTMANILRASTYLQDMFDQASQNLHTLGVQNDVMSQLLSTTKP